jgi:hypothetical protein
MEASTITQQINLGKSNKMTNTTFCEKTLVKADNDTFIILNLGSILSKYWSQLKKSSYVYQFTEPELQKFEYRPNLLSYSLYGTIEFAPFILKLNNMVSETEFGGFKTLRLFNSNIRDLLNEILIREKQTFIQNEIRLNKDLASAISS